VVLVIVTCTGISVLIMAGLFVYLRRRFLGEIQKERVAAGALEKRLLQQELLSALSQSFISSDDTGVLIHNALMMLVMSMKVGRAALARHNPETGLIAFEYEWSDPGLKLPPLHGEGVAFTTGELFYDTFAVRGDVYLVSDTVEAEPRFAEEFGHPGLQSCIFVPITLWGQFWGVLGIGRHTRGQSWNEGDIQILKLVSGAITSLLVRADAERALVRAKEEAESSSLAKSTFLSRMSHEMRTPMNAIIGMTAIARKSRDQHKMEYCLGRIGEASMHLLGVINDILDMSKIEAGKFELSCTEFDFERMLNRVTDMMEFKINEKRQHFIVRFDPEMPQRIISDEQRLAQVLTNLLSNAVKFTPEKGTIILSARAAGGGEHTRTFRFDVIDSGIGISREQQQRLFTPFEQADGSISRKFGGTGLGLAISKNIVEMMGGAIWIESEPGKGSDFAFEITVEPGTAPEKSGPRLIKEHIRILAADGSAELLDYFREYARLTNIQCITASDGPGAYGLIENAAEPPCEIVFADWRLPNMNGIELGAYVKTRFRDTPVLLMISASEWETVEADAKKAGIDGFIPKPLFPSVITDTINRYLAGPAAAAEAAGGEALAGIFAGRAVILAEDVDINREIVLTLLEETGLAIDSAENGAAAVRLFTDNPARYDLILMDIHMPEMDGFEATRTLRALGGRGAEIPIIAMTANVFKEDIDKCLEAGMNDHIGKPIEFDRLIERLRQYLPGQSF
jgi:signal transduction histidine kinase/DNA-binding response OmpR family regulator